MPQNCHWAEALQKIEDRLVEKGELERLPDGTTRSTEHGKRVAKGFERFMQQSRFHA